MSTNNSPLSRIFDKGFFNGCLFVNYDLHNLKDTLQFLNRSFIIFLYSNSCKTKTSKVMRGEKNLMKKKYIVLLLLAFFVIAPLLAACGSGGAEENSQDDTEVNETENNEAGADNEESTEEVAGVEGTVTIAGSTSVQPLSEELAAVFMDQNPEARVEVAGGGSGAGVTAAQENAADFGAASREIKEDETGIISYDRYWNYIEENSSFRSNHRVKKVLEIVNTLRGIIRNNVSPMYKNMANQIVNALAIYRLTTDDLKTPIGLSSETLRDTLFISQPTLLEFEDDPAGFLQTTIDAAVKNLRKEASYQYISLNKENGQYYINIDQTIPVDELINQRGETLSKSQLDSYYFEILKKATRVSENTYVHGYKIWLHESPWSARRVKRQGYLFFGAPNERSTAQPERDFYIYVLQPFEEPKFKDEERPDEVFFRLKEKDEQFVNLLRLYG